MNTIKNWADIALRGTLIIFLPLLLLLYITYNPIFTIDLTIHGVFIFLFLAGFLRWLIDKYRHQRVEEEVQSFDGLAALIEQGKWEVVEHGQDKLVIRPTFDAPFNYVLNDKITLRYTSRMAVIEGPKYYINMLAKTIRGEEIKWIRRGTALVKDVIFISIVAMPLLLGGSNVFWSYNVYRHNARPASAIEIERPESDVSGNRPENSLNRGQAVENETFIFYVENQLNLVRTNKAFESKEYLIQKEGGHGIGDLNIVEDWLYFTEGEVLKRMRFDGTEETPLYDLGYLLNMRIQGNWIYFESMEDGFSIYKMDLNGQHLGKVLDASGIGMTIHEDRLLVSQEDNDHPRIESYDLEGGDRQDVLDVYAHDVIVWEDAYYYIGEDSALYRSEKGETAEPQLLVNEEVASFIPTDESLIYTLLSEENRYYSTGLYQVNFDGTGQALLSASNDVGGFSRIGDSILFSAQDGYGMYQEKILDLDSGRIDLLK
ncbi:MAG: DUF5050 domain-containing protein [Alkalibacterium sp.]|nr:DUF5050 domain-containing protein [Alkalibacterium sp.]